MALFAVPLRVDSIITSQLDVELATAAKWLHIKTNHPFSLSSTNIYARLYDVVRSVEVVWKESINHLSDLFAVVIAARLAQLLVLRDS